MESMIDIDIPVVATAYIEAAAWADALCACAAECECETGDRQHLEIAPEDRAYVERLCALFVEQNQADVEECLRALAGRHTWAPEEQLGHDLRLSSGGHGTGFFDRGLGDLGERLQAASQAGPFCRISGGDCWEGEDGQLRFDHRCLEG